jgi:isopentenyl-diphosphate delta-isomerase
MEKLEVFDENGKQKGVIETREAVHVRGLWHRTVHIWVYRGSEILLQRRSRNKDSHPGLWDVSAAGHIGIGESVFEAAVRETAEELGIEAEENDLLYIGTRRCTLVSRQGRFIDREFTNIYLYCFEKSMDDLVPDPEEIEELRFYEIDVLKRLLGTDEAKKNFVPHERSYYMWVLDLIADSVSP